MIANPPDSHILSALKRVAPLLAQAGRSVRSAVAGGILLAMAAGQCRASDEQGRTQPQQVGPIAVSALPGFGPIMSVEASSEDGPAWAAQNIVDWDWLSSWRSSGEKEGAWVQINFAGLQRVGAIQLVDRANEIGEAAAIRFTFSDGTDLDYLLPPHPEYPGLEQPGFTYTPVDEHILAGYAESPSSIVHAWDAHTYPLNYTRNKGAFFLRFEPRVTSFVRVTITQMLKRSRRAVGEPFLAQLAMVRPVIIPDSPQPIATEAQLDVAARSHFGLTQIAPAEDWLIENGDFRLEISKRTGLIQRFTSLLPVPVDLCADGPAGPATVLYAQCIDRGWTSRFDQLVSWRLSENVDKGQRYQELVCIIAPSTNPVATATIRYRLFPDRLEQNLRFDYLVHDWARYRMGIYYQSDPKLWPEHRDTGGWDSTKLAYVKAYSHAYDICWEQGDWRCLMWPLDVLRRDDRYLLWGSFDLRGPHMVMAPRIPDPGGYPSLYSMPLFLQQGDSYTLDLFWKSFSRDTNGYAEVLNWYARRTSFDVPELAGIPVRLTQERPRVLPGGGRLAPGVRPSYPMDTEEHLQDLEAAMVKVGVRHVVYGGWDAWVNAPESIGADTVWPAAVGQLSTAQMQSDVQASRKAGLRSYLYLNHFSKPPWRGGQRMSADDPRDREWFIERFKSFYTTVDFDGVFWDTGWHPISWSSPNIWISRNPRGDELQGWLKIFARIYTWVKANDPNDCVLSGCAAAPTFPFTDAAHIEGGQITSPVMADDARAFMKPMLAYCFPPYRIMSAPALEKRGIKQADLVESGMPPEVEEEIWNRWMELGLKAVGLGRSLVTQGELLVEPETITRRTVHPAWRGWAYFMPQTQQTPELDRFCSRITGLPMMWQTRAITFPAETKQTAKEPLYGSVWAGESEMLASIYCSIPAPNIAARINRQLLREYGFAKPGPAPKVVVLDPRASAQPDRTLECTVDADAIRIDGELRTGELAMIFWPAKGNR